MKDASSFELWWKWWRWRKGVEFELYFEAIADGICPLKAEYEKKASRENLRFNPKQRVDAGAK